MRDVGWIDVTMPAGTYKAAVHGFRELDAKGREIVAAGYDFILEPCPVLPLPTADLARNMRVLRLDI